MKFVNPFKKREYTKPVIAFPKTRQDFLKNLLTEQFKGEVENKKAGFPKELGVEHPFNPKLTEELYKGFGVITGIIDKYVDFIVGPGFFVKGEDKRAVQIINDFVDDTEFDTLLRAWIKEALAKQSGFLEIGGRIDESPKGLKVLDAKYMYVVRDEKGVVTGYNQFVGAFKEFDNTKVIKFKPYQIAQINFNKIGDMAYGLGIIFPALRIIDNLFDNQASMTRIMRRKSNSPLVAKVGTEDEPAVEEDIITYATEMEHMTDRTEWAHDHRTEMKVLDFGKIGDKFEFPINHDVDMMIFAFQVPEVLMGRSVNLATAPVQMDAFERRIKSIQAEVEKVIENNIFMRVLESQGIKAKVEFEWGQPSTTEKNNRILQITELLKIPALAQPLSLELQMQLAELMGVSIPDLTPEDLQRQKEEDTEQPQAPGQNRKEICNHFVESNKDYTIKEWLGFNFGKYLDEIRGFIKKDGFMLLKANNQIELDAGRLSDVQISKLKNVLDDGFRNSNTMREIANDIGSDVSPKNLFKMKDGEIVYKDGEPVIQTTASKRPLIIARSEVTRTAAEGARKHYKLGGVKKYRWISSVGERTCAQCEALNGQIFDIDEAPFLPPQHTMCRCSIVAETELI